MKKTIVIILIAILISISSFLYFSHPNPIFYATENNIRIGVISNSHKIQIGMKEKDVVFIMGDPSDKIYKTDTDFTYLYDVDFDSEPYVEIKFDRNQKVKSVTIQNYLEL